MRLDLALVVLGLSPSRSRARDSIKRGMVFVDGTQCVRAAQEVHDNYKIEIKDPASQYVSRAALKLVGALEHFGLDPKDKIALDIGASTGGFTQVLLERGATHVFALDVGIDQLAKQLRGRADITLLEKTNARDFDISSTGPLGNSKIEFVASDVSFISLKLALPPALKRAQDGALGVFLVKPQFEVGRENIGKNGIVTDPDLAEACAHEMSEWLNTQSGWQSIGITRSPIKGGDGNVEYLLAATKNRS